MEAIVPPFAALLRRWRPLLSGIHELTDAEGQSPLAVEDRALASDAVPSEVSCCNSGLRSSMWTWHGMHCAFEVVHRCNI